MCCAGEQAVSTQSSRSRPHWVRCTVTYPHPLWKCVQTSMCSLDYAHSTALHSTALPVSPLRASCTHLHCRTFTTGLPLYSLQLPLPLYLYMLHPFWLRQ